MCVCVSGLLWSDDVDKILHFALSVEAGVSVDTVSNYDAVRQQIVTQLAGLRDQPNIEVSGEQPTEGQFFGVLRSRFTPFFFSSSRSSELFF